MDKLSGETLTLDSGVYLSPDDQKQIIVYTSDENVKSIRNV